MKRTLKLLSTMTFFFMIAAGLALAPPNAHAQQQEKQQKTEKKSEDLMSTIKAQDNLSTFADALKKTGLAATLQSEESYTVFAPTNEAFSALDLSAKSTEQVKTLLKGHIVAGAVSASAAAEQGSLSTMNEGTITVSDGMVNGTASIQTSMQAGNGVIHVVDAVLVSGSASR